MFDEAPDGRRERVTHGYADSHTWQSERQWTDLTPDTPYRWTLRLQPTAVVVERGHRLVLVIASQDSRITTTGQYCFSDYRGTGGCYDPSGIVPATTAGRATNTVHLGPGATSLQLDWADPAQTQIAPFPAPEPSG